MYHLHDQHYSDGFSLQWIKDYHHFSAASREWVSYVSILDDTVKTQRNGFPVQEISFILGGAQKQKIVQMTISLMVDRNDSNLFSVMTHQEETIMYQEPKSITSRISSFITQKLGYNENDNNEGLNAIRNIIQVGQFMVAITGKDFIIIRKSDRVRVYESDYLESLRENSNRQDTYSNVQVMREVLQFKYLSSSAILIQSTNQICVSFFIQKTQIVSNPQSYSTLKQTQILHLPRLFMVTQNNQLDPNQESNVNLHDLEKFASTDINKAFAVNFEYFTEEQGEDVTTLLIVEFKGGKTIAIEHSLSSNLQNIQILRNIRLNGYSAQIQRDEDARELFIYISLLTQKEVDLYHFDPAKQPFSMVAPVGLFAGSLSKQVIVSQQRPVQQQEKRIVQRDQLKSFIHTLLDQVAAYKYQSISKSQNQIDQNRENSIQSIINEVQKTLSFVTPSDYIQEVKDIMKEQIDLPINDSHFAANTIGDRVNPVFNDDGLVMRSLENKIKKMEVIYEFLQINDFYNPDEDLELREIFNQLNFKLLTAKYLREYQESLKVQSTGSSKYLDYPLEMRLLSQVIQYSSDKLGFNADVLKQKGVTSATVVYSNISCFDDVLKILIDICVDSNIQAHVQLRDNHEDQYQVIFIAGHFLNQIVKQMIETQSAVIPETYFGDINFIEKVFNLLEKIELGSVYQNQALQKLLQELSKTFMSLLHYAELEKSENYNDWKNNIVLMLERSISKEVALAFAEKYQSDILLCRLAWEIGKPAYNVIHRCVQNWGENFLQIAMHHIYELEKFQALQRQTIASSEYRGFQMFEIFEGQYLSELADFLRPKNKKLSVLLSLRHKDSDFANSLLSQNVIPSIKRVQTMKVFSSLALANAQNCTQNPTTIEEQDYFEGKLNLAQVQSMALPEQEELIPVNESFLKQAYQKFSQSNPYEQANNLRKIFEILNYQGKFTNVDNIPQLKQYVWKLLVSNDINQIQNMQSRLPQNSQGLHLYTESQTKDLMNKTLIYQFANQYRQSICQLDEDLQRDIALENPVLQPGLLAIFSQLRDEGPNLFSQRQSTMNQIPFGDDQIMT